MISQNMIKLIQTAKNKLGLSDGEYRTILARVANVTSCKDLDRDGFDAVMGLFEWLGFEPRKAGGPDYGNRPDMASFKQLELIRALWFEWTQGAGTNEGLAIWIERTFKVTSPRFLTTEAAQKAIGALKAMKANRAA